jgi:putative colanic acid biosysnthesis UDP-glucose lipid carrier transferase
MQRAVDSAIVIVVLWGLIFFFQIDFSYLYIILTVIAVLTLWPVFEATGIYYSYRSEHPAATYPRLYMAWMTVFMLLLLTGYATQTSALFPRRLICSWFFVTPVVLSLHHLAVRLLLRQVRATGLNTRKAVIAGTSKLSEHLAQQIQESPQLGLQFCGFFAERPLEAMEKIATRPLIGTLEELPDYVRRHRIDVVYIAVALQDEETVTPLINALQDTTACVYFAPNIMAFSLMQARVQNFEGIPLVAVWEIPATSLQIVAKRITDVVVVSFALLLVSPLVVALMIALKASSAESILVRQRRYDFDGKSLLVYRFRTRKRICPSQEKTELTWVGALIEKTGLETLPQLINVLQGRLSIVGPRPQRVAHPELYRRLGTPYRLGLNAKPGLTGLAQIHGLSDDCETPEGAQQQLFYDLDYLRSWSFWLDLKIMSQGALCLFRPKPRLVD